MTANTSDTTPTLLKYLESSETDFGPGAKSGEIDRFAIREKVALPIDLVSYLQSINGTNGDYAPGMVALWRLDQFQRLSCELDGSKRESTALIQSAYANAPVNADQYFVFADFMHEAKLYAIRLADCVENGEVLILDGEPPRVVAKSFSEFIELLINDPAAIGGEPD
jgi:hypothetical protein